jgi:Flp pilus assembly protein TadB
MSTSEPSGQRPLQPNEPYSATERVEEAATEIGLVGALTLRAVEVGILVLIGLLVCPPLFILVVVVVVPLVALTVLVSLIAAVLATPYLIVGHVRGHRARHAELRHRLGRAFHALLDIAPHRLLAAIRRSHPAG